MSTLHAHAPPDAALADVESCTAKGSAEVSDRPDPFSLRQGLKTDAQIAEIREGCQQRKNGKRLEKFYRKQNDVRMTDPSSPLTSISSSNLQSPNFLLCTYFCPSFIPR